METQQTIRSILDSLRRLVRELRISSRRAETPFGLTAARLFVLQRVAAHQPVSINELAELTLTHQSSASVVVRRLVEHGFLQQRQAPQDRRRKELSLTPRGRRAIKRVPTSIQDRIIAGLSAMRADDQRTLDHLLRRVIETIGMQDSHPVLFFEDEPHQRRRRVGPSIIRQKQQK